MDRNVFCIDISVRRPKRKSLPPIKIVLDVLEPFRIIRLILSYWVHHLLSQAAFCYALAHTLPSALEITGARTEEASSPQEKHRESLPDPSPGTFSDP
eukprot:5028269-Amphidinium_carterae.1